jgi:lambda repressor-like predicted transcriptional regulator
MHRPAVWLTDGGARLETLAELQKRQVLLREHLSNQNSPFVKLMRQGWDSPSDDLMPPLPQVNEVDAGRYRMNRKLNPDEKAELAKLYKDGASLQELSRKFECHRHTVDRHLQRAGIEVRPQKLMTPHLVTQATKLYADGNSLADVGKQLGVEASTVGKALKRSGVKLRPPVADRSHGSRDE